MHDSFCSHRCSCVLPLKWCSPECRLGLIRSFLAHQKLVAFLYSYLYLELFLMNQLFRLLVLDFEIPCCRPTMCVLLSQLCHSIIYLILSNSLSNTVSLSSLANSSSGGWPDYGFVHWMSNAHRLNSCRIYRRYKSCQLLIMCFDIQMNTYKRI